jgi:hypothetical protein
MKNEKIDVPLDLDAKILQYAESRKFNRMCWYRTLSTRAAAVIVIGAIIGTVQLAGRKNDSRYIQQLAENTAQENFDWNEFEEKLEYVDNEIADAAFYLAQL